MDDASPHRPRRASPALLGLVLAVVLAGMGTVLTLTRIRNEDWERRLPLAALDRWLGPPPVRWMRRGPFTLVRSRDRSSGLVQSRLHPGPVWFDPHEADMGLYGWQFHSGGGDLNGNGRPNLVMVRHEGGNTDTFGVFELVDGVAVQILQATGSPGFIEGPDAQGLHHFVGDLERQPYDDRWVRIPLVAGAEPEDIPPR